MQLKSRSSCMVLREKCKDAICNFGTDLQVTKVNSEQLQQEITARTCPLVIDFYATWCGPCLLLAKELEKVPLLVIHRLISTQIQSNCISMHLLLQVAEQLGDKVKILKVDTDENPELSNQLRVRSFHKISSTAWMYRLRLPILIARPLCRLRGSQPWCS